MGKSIGSKLLSKKKAFTFVTDAGDIITAHAMKSDQRKLSGKLASGMKVHSPIIFCSDDGIVGVKATKCQKLTSKDLEMTRKAIAVANGSLLANMLKK